ncbi:MAG: allophanate hydrolase [Acidiferrobacterales bacterium]|nr:allophanate hydrolase [Acidiferrobacterales bacterium]
MNQDNIALDIASLLNAYRDEQLTPNQVIDYVLQKSEQFTQRNIWIRQLTKQEIKPYLDSLEKRTIDELPLYGIPFAIKDNIDLANITTTAACPSFAYTPSEHAFIVEQLIDAGAIPIGKTNLDQFATGLVGTRSPEPWGPCGNSFNADYISGGSSAGSAVAVALGLASFSLGTDTAGSGRVPAMLNNLYGHKPSRGLFSMSGVVPACRSLDCPSIFALSAEDAKQVFNVAARFDETDCYARANSYSNSHRYFGKPSSAPKVAVPLSENLEFFDNQDGKILFDKAVKTWQSLGADIHPLDISPLLEAAKLLYEGPWVSERYAAIEDLMQTTPDKVHPVVRDIVKQAEDKTSIETFQYEYKMQEYRMLAKQIFKQFDFLMTPTAPSTYTIEQVLKDPITLNSNMGYYTNYMNLLDLCGVAVPAGFMSNQLPFGVTFIAPAMQDQKLLSYAHLWQKTCNRSTGAIAANPPLSDPFEVDFQENIEVAVCGAHLSGMPLNWQLTERRATLIKTSKTSQNYTMVALAGGPPERPGLFRNSKNGHSIEIEIWSMPSAELGSFLANIPAPLGLGKLETQSGDWVTGFICEEHGADAATDISHYGSWRSYLNSKNN